MIKSELVQKLASQSPHLYQRDLEHIVNIVLDEITGALEEGGRVKLSGFGAFIAKERTARTGRNPHEQPPKANRPENSSPGAILIFQYRNFWPRRRNVSTPLFK